LIQEKSSHQIVAKLGHNQGNKIFFQIFQLLHFALAKINNGLPQGIVISLGK
jgi:hypothetical protein